MRILLIEDDNTVAQSIQMMLKSEGCICDTTDLGEDGLEIGKLYEYDVILLDLKLPDIHGQDVIKRLRATGIMTPIFIISGYADTQEKIAGLNHGADDFLEKPFDKQELMARLQAVFRRSKGHAAPQIRIGRLCVNLEQQTAYIDDHKIDLTVKEYKVLELLCIRKGATITKDMFLNHLYGGFDEPEAKIIDVFVCKLRGKLKSILGPNEDYIETVWGRGYALREPKDTTTTQTTKTTTPTHVHAVDAKPKVAAAAG